MKKIKMFKNVLMEINKIKEDEVEFRLINKSSNSSQVFTRRIEICSVCGNAYFAEQQIDTRKICSNCQAVFLDWSKRETEVKNNPVKTASTKTPHERNTPNSYYLWKEDNLSIDNLVELHNLVVNTHSLQRLDTLLKCAVMRMTYKEISEKLHIPLHRIQCAYTQLKKMGMVMVEDDKRLRVLPIVKYHFIKESHNPVTGKSVKPKKLSSRAIYNRSDQLYDLYSKFLETWTGVKYFSQVTKLNMKTAWKYLNQMYLQGKLSKRMVKSSFRGYSVEFKIKRI